MSLKLSSIKRNRAQEDEGQWENVVGWPGVRVKVRGINYKPYQIAREMMIIIQVNGKVRDTVIVPAEASDEEIERTALERPLVAKWVGDQEIKKVIVVKGRLLNVVTSD